MKKIKKTSELLWIFGIVFVALGVTICSKANLGVSMVAAPAFIISEFISQFNSFFNVGVTEYILQGLMLIALCITVKKFNWRYLLAFAVAVLYGYTLNFFIWIFADLEFSAVWLRYIMLIIGDIITAFGVACFFRTYMPLQVYELFVAEISDNFRIKIDKVKGVFDISLLLVSIILSLVLFSDTTSFDWSSLWHTSFHSIGIGTIITTAINSPIISLMGKLIDRFFDNSPCFLKLEFLLKRNHN